MKITEELAILTAFKKAVDDRIKEVRSVANEELRDAYDDMGYEKMALKIDGQKVGDFIISFTKEGYKITDESALNEFALDYGFANIYKTIKEDRFDEAVSFLASMAPEFIALKIKRTDDWDKGITYIDGECCYLDSGMIIPGIEYVPRKPKNTMVKGCNPKDVLPITQRLGGIDKLLLEGE